MTSTTRNAIPHRIGAASRLIPVAVMVTAALVSTAPAAAAQTEKQIQANCAGVNGGYNTHTLNGNTYTSCCYKDAEGVRACDIYVNGVYQGNIPYKQGPPPPSAFPKPPPNAAPIPTNPPPEAH